VILALAPSSVGGLITAAATLITAIGGAILSITVLIPLLRTSRDTHKIVNQQRTDMQRYQRALINALDSAGVTVPTDQSLDTSEPPPQVQGEGSGR
jgi:hypothetical protein